MRQIAEQSGRDLERALQKAKENAGSYLSQGRSSLEWTWLRPTYLAGGEKAVVFEAEDFNIQGSSLDELLKHREFRRRMSEAVSVRRVWGPLGLLWELLIQRLEDGQRFGSCEKCGRMIDGRKGKKFCGSEDNPECFRGRRASDQRKSRSKRNWFHEHWLVRSWL